VPRQKPALEAKAPGQAIAFFTEKEFFFPQLAGCAVPWGWWPVRMVSSFVSLTGPRNASPAEHQAGRQWVAPGWQPPKPGHRHMEKLLSGKYWHPGEDCSGCLHPCVFNF